jgi:signal transduction histidine kinase
MLNWAMLQTDQLFFQREDLNLLAIVNQVTFNYEPLLKSKNIALKNTIKQNMFVYADLESLKIVLRNVLDNAIKFSNSNDQISIYAKVSPEKKCELIIEDTGSGMSQEVVSELLKETLKESQKVTKERTGLGLHLCQAMMLKNEGALKIESEENIGTKLIISIPLTQNHE